MDSSDIKIVRDGLDRIIETAGLADFAGTARDSKKFFRCPFHRDNKPSMTLAPCRTYCTCWAEGKKYDSIDFLREVYGCRTFPEAVRKGLEILGANGISESEKARIEADAKRRREQAEAEERKAREKQEARDHEFILKAQNSYHGSPAEEYMISRGIHERVAEEWHIGYGEIITYVDGTRTLMRGVVIPRDDLKGYTLRNIDIPADTLTRKGEKCRRSGALKVYHADRLYTKDVAYITEGEIDGMSIDEIAVDRGIAIGGAGEGWLARYIASRGTPSARVVIATDADSAGEAKAKEIARIITNAGGICYRMPMGAKDPNLWMLQDYNGYAEALRSAWREVKRR